MFLFTFRKHQVVTVKLVVLTKPSEIKREEKTEEMGENRERLWYSTYDFLFTFSAWTLLGGQQKGHPGCKN